MREGGREGRKEGGKRPTLRELETRLQGAAGLASRGEQEGHTLAHTGRRGREGVSE